MTQSTSPTTLDENDLESIIAALDAGWEAAPEAAIRAAQKQRDRIVPRLIETIRATTRATQSGIEIEGSAYWYALFLLAEFKAKEALPAVLDLLSLPSDDVDHVLGDLVHDSLPAILAALIDDARALHGPLVDSTIDPWVRLAFANTLVYLVRDGLVTREEAIHRIQLALRQAIEEEDVPTLSLLISKLCALGIHESIDEIRGAFERDLVDEMIVNFEDVEEALHDPEGYFNNSMQRFPASGVADTLEISRNAWWLRGADDDLDPTVTDEMRDLLNQLRATLVDDDPPPPIVDDTESFRILDEAFAPTDPIRRTEQRVGRNDPCPCGSGKKYKVCCRD